MPTPTSTTYSLAARIAAHTAVRDMIDSGPSAGFVRFKSSADVVLAQVPLSDPCGSVSGSTGQLTFSISGPDLSADADGIIAYGEFCDSTGAAVVSVPAKQGTVADPGYIVINTLSISVGGQVAILSATVG